MFSVLIKKERLVEGLTLPYIDLQVCSLFSPLFSFLPLAILGVSKSWAPPKFCRWDSSSAVCSFVWLLQRLLYLLHKILHLLCFPSTATPLQTHYSCILCLVSSATTSSSLLFQKFVKASYLLMVLILFSLSFGVYTVILMGSQREGRQTPMYFGKTSE